MKKIVITNIYGGKNIGDMAIRNEGLKIIEDAVGIQDLYLLCESNLNFPIQTKMKSKVTIAYAPYGYAIRSKNTTVSLFMKSFRFFSIVILSCFYTIVSLINKNLLPKGGFYKYIKYIKNADLLIAMGGGYFITSHPIKDFFGICLNVLPLFIAKVYKKKIIILPSSFGPFAHKIHEGIVGYAVKNTTFMVREDISLKYLRKYCNDTKYTPDLALYDFLKKRVSHKDNYYVLTFREGLSMSQEKQYEIESYLSKFIIEIWKIHKLSCIFIPMASNPIEENDLNTAYRLKKRIKNSKIFTLVTPKTPEEVKQILKYAKFSICNRLHSAILSATVFTPFITVAYAHKTNGFMRSFDLEEWNINMPELTYDELWSKFGKLIQTKHYDSFIQKLELNHQKIKQHRQEIVSEIRKSI